MATKAPSTQKDNHKEVKNLLLFFNNPPAPIDQIEPKHIRQYLDWRIEYTKSQALKKGKEVNPNMGSVRANREKALFSHIFNFAREYGYTSRENPCQGVKGLKERGRKDIYVSDEMLNQVLVVADKPAWFALRLAYLTGQRPSDVLKMKVTDIYDSYLHLQQNKTKERVRILITGELQELLVQIQKYRNNLSAKSTSLLIDEKGKALTSRNLRTRFDKAREDAGIEKSKFQFRDLRAKAATDVNEYTDIKKAQTLLGHTSKKMTEHYIRHRLGKKANPIK